MRDKRLTPLCLEGKTVILKEVEPKYFPYIIEWRNNKEFTRFLNQPFTLTMENETHWYQNVYLKDPTQGLLLMTDKNDGTPFGTLGWTDLDLERRRYISGRLLVGNLKYRGSVPMMESFFVMGDYLWQFADVSYAHVVIENRKVISLNKRTGHFVNKGEIQFPKELFVNGMHQVELMRTRDSYHQAKVKMARWYPDIFKAD
mgnify:FL=1